MRFILGHHCPLTLVPRGREGRGLTSEDASSKELTQHTTPFPRGSAPSACSPSSSCSASASASGSPGGGSRAGGILTPIMVISTPSGVMTMSLAMKPNGLHTSAATYECACVCECACVHACLCACVLSLLCGEDQLGWPRANCRPQSPEGHEGWPRGERERRCRLPAGAVGQLLVCKTLRVGKRHTLAWQRYPWFQTPGPWPSSCRPSWASRPSVLQAALFSCVGRCFPPQNLKTEKKRRINWMAISAR